MKKGVANAFETWCWRRMLRIKWTYRITNDEVFQSAKEVILLLKIKKNRHHSWIGHTVRHNEFAVTILEGAIFGKNGEGRPGLQYLKHVTRNTAADSYRAKERMACNSSRRKAANQSGDRKIRRRLPHVRLQHNTTIYIEYTYNIRIKCFSSVCSIFVVDKPVRRFSFLGIKYQGI